LVQKRNAKSHSENAHVNEPLKRILLSKMIDLNEMFKVFIKRAARTWVFFIIKSTILRLF
jgi:hypothetical protein